MRRRTLLALILLASSPLSTPTAAASSLSPGSSKVSAGTSTVAKCDSDGVTITSFRVNYDTTNNRYYVSQIRLSGIDAACNGGTLYVTLADVSNGSLANASASVAATTATLAISGSPPSANIKNVHVAIPGP